MWRNQGIKPSWEFYKKSQALLIGKKVYVDMGSHLGRTEWSGDPAGLDMSGVSFS